MKSAIALVGCTLLPCLAVAAARGDFEHGYALAQQKGCFECHQLGYRDAGPAFRQIARRYRFDPEARDRLPYVIRGGSAGHWGDRYVMWPQPRLSDAEVDELVDWILAQ
jgi:cytochrome c